MDDNPKKVIQRIRDIIKLKNKDHWFDVFEKADCCCSIVKSMEEAISDNHFKVRKVFSKKINLGLDLQGGSYLLLEIDNDPVELQKLQNTATDIRNFLNKENIKFIDLRISNKSIIFNVDPTLKEKTESFFIDKDSEINPYYPQYKSHQFDLISSNNEFQLKLSDYGLVEIKTSSQDQAIEIVRRRVDEVGTNEPNILKRGNDRILIACNNHMNNFIDELKTTCAATPFIDDDDW